MADKTFNVRVGESTVPTQPVGDSSQHIANTSFVTTAISNAVAGINPAMAVVVATITVLPNTPTYNNGVSGVGATLTAGANSTLTIDGRLLALNERVLVKNQASAFQNGIYFVSQAGSGILPWILTRALDYNQPSDINSTGVIPVTNGTDITGNKNTSWVLITTITTIGTDPLSYQQFTYSPTNARTPVFVRETMGDANKVMSAGKTQVALITALTAPRTLTIPLANSFTEGSEIMLDDEILTINSINTVTITASGGDLINGNTTLVVGKIGAKVKLVSDGVSKWTGGVDSSYYATLITFKNNETFYVNSATGNNANNGTTAGTPFATIQRAIDVLALATINSNVVINVASGSYIEQVTVPTLIFGGDYRVTVKGNVTAQFTSQCTGASTQYSQSAGNVVPAKLNDTSQAWGINSQQKRYIHITGGAGYDALRDENNWYIIIANTATSLSIAGDWNTALDNTTTYQILSYNSTIGGAGVSQSNISFKGTQRVTFQNFILNHSVGFAVYSTMSQENILLACSISSDNAGFANVGIIGGGFRVISCYSKADNLIQNISWFEAFGQGEYDENFITSASFTNSVTGIKGNWIDGSTLSGIQFSGSHTRLTGNYFTNNTGTAIIIGRRSDMSIYGNDVTGQDLTLLDQSYLKIHSGNKIRNIIVTDSNILKSNGGPPVGAWFSSIVSKINLDNRSGILGSTFTATTENYNTDSARIYASGDQSVANTGVVTVVLDTVRYDPSGLKTGNTLVAQKAGWYNITFNGSWASGAGNKRTARILVNATNVAIDQRVPVGGGNQTVFCVSTQYYLNVGDAVSVTVSQDSAGNLALQALANFSSELSISLT